MTYLQLCKYFNETRPTGVASHIGYTTQNVNNWKLANRIPPRAQMCIELITGGKLKADKVKPKGKK